MNTSFFPDVIVNGETIPSAAIAAEAQNHEAPTGKPGLAWRKAARALIIRQLLLQEAQKRDLKAEPFDLGQGKRETDEEALVRAVLEVAVDVETPTDQEVNDAWAKDPDRFRSPPLWEVSHILCAADPTDAAACEKAKTRAETLNAQALKNPWSFGRLAKEESDCSSKSDGGVLGQLSPGDTVPEFEAALRNLKEGHVTPKPVASRFGYHVIRLDAVAEGRVLPFLAVAPKLRDAMEKAAWTKAVYTFTHALTAQAEVVGIDLEAF